MLDLNRVGYRRKSKEPAAFEFLTGLIAVVGFLFLGSPQFRQLAQIIVVLFVILAIVVFGIWIAIKANKPELTPQYRTSESSYQTWTPARSESPTRAGKLQSVQIAPEPRISEKLRAIDWFQFEKLVELIYRNRGFSVKRRGGANPDGGVDLIVESSSTKFVVQCKHWRKWKVGVRHIREFLGTLTDSRISKGVFITLVGYSADAKQLANKHGIQILNETDLTRMLTESGMIYSKDVSGLLSDVRKFCPRCEREMVLRTARVKGNRFWGCSKYPRCKFTLNFEE